MKEVAQDHLPKTRKGSVCVCMCVYGSGKGIEAYYCLHFYTFGNPRALCIQLLISPISIASRLLSLRKSWLPLRDLSRHCRFGTRDPRLGFPLPRGTSPSTVARVKTAVVRLWLHSLFFFFFNRGKIN